MRTASLAAVLIAIPLAVTGFAPMTIVTGIVSDTPGGFETVTMADHMRFIQVNSFRFDPLRESPDIPSILRYDTANVGSGGYYLLQFDRPITPDMRLEIEAVGLTVLHYISYNAYVVRATPSEIELAELISEVRWTGVFEPAYKLSPRLSDRFDEMVRMAVEGSADTTDSQCAVSFGSAKVPSSDSVVAAAFDKAFTPTAVAAEDAVERRALTLEKAERSLRTSGSRIVVDVMPFEGSAILRVADAVAAVGGTGIVYSSNVVRAEIDRAVLPQLARTSEVMWIDRFVQPQFYNDIARWVLQSGDDIGYYSPIHDAGIWGTGQTITVGDSGIDYEHNAFEDPDVSSPGSTHRKVTDYYIPSDANGDLSDNDINHGTHVSGTVAGDDGVWHVYDGDPTGSNGTVGPHDGQAFDAMLQVQDLSPDGYYVFPPSDFHDMYQPALDRGSWIHTNSWGSIFGDYTSKSQETDDFLWNNQDFIVLFAAGNYGSYPGVISPHAAAKNTIGVGASSNGANMNDVAAFSSRGPAADGRIKPDVMAPGVNIWSAQGGDPGGELDTYWTLSGTSMATPNAAGSVALIRQYYMDGWYPTGKKELGNSFTPSAALVKATLVNGAVEMTGVGAYDEDWDFYPNSNQGWGRILLENCLYFEGQTRGLVVEDNRAGVSTGELETYEIAIGDDSVSVEVTLVWTDYPGAPFTSPSLVNDLDLVVTGPDGTVYVGNRFHGMNPGESVPNPGAVNYSADRLNNVESVLVITNVQSGLWTVEVRGHNVPMGPQSYAIVMTGGIATDKGVVQLDNSVYTSSSTVGVRVVDVGLDLSQEAADVTWTWARSPRDLENLTLTETGLSTGVFMTSFQLEDSVSGTSGDGILQVLNGDVITVEYYDENDGLGGSGWTTDEAVIDDDPPLISNVGVANIRFNRATITWTTDELSDSVVCYDSTIPPTTTKTDSRLVTSHTISLSDLIENTVYHFTVASADKAGNEARDDNSSEYYWFRTAVRPPIAPADPEWPTFHNNQPRQGVSPSQFEPPLELMWSDGTYFAEYWTSPVLKDDILYTTTCDGYLRARDPYSGQLIWQRNLGGMMYYTGTPVVENGVIFAALSGGVGGYPFYALDARTGETIWSTGPELGLMFNARVALACDDGLVFGSTWDNQIVALNASDGSVEWIFVAPAQPFGGITVNQGTLFMPCGNTVLALDELSGTLLWSALLDDTCTATPLLAEGNIYEGTYGGTMYALDADTGEVVWSRTGYGLIDYSTPAYDGGAIYFAAWQDFNTPIYVALDSVDGALLWQTTVGALPSLSSLAYANGYVYGTDWDGFLTVLSANNGTVVQRIELNLTGSTSCPAISDGWVWVEDIQGNIYAFFGHVPVALMAAPLTQSKHAVPGTALDFYVNVTNMGDLGSDRFDVSVELGVLGWPITLYESDGVTPLPDTDGDSLPDTGTLNRDETATVIVRVTVPGGAVAGEADTSVVTFRSSNDLEVNRSVEVTSSVPPPGIWVGPSAYFSPYPGETVTASLEVRNMGGFPDTFDIVADSRSGWTVALMMDDGITPLDDSDGDAVPDTGSVAGLESSAIKVLIEVPLDIPIGTLDVTTVVGTSSLETSVNHTCTVIIELPAPPNEEWPTFHNDPARRGRAADVFMPPIELQWIVELNSDNILTGPVLADGILFETTCDGAIRAHDPYTGALLWQRILGGTYYYTSTPTVDGGVVFVPFSGSAGHYVYALDAQTGATQWVLGPETGIDFNARIAMATENGKVFGSSWDGLLFALNTSDGSFEWTFETGGLPFAGPAVSMGMLFQGTVYTNQMFAVDIDTGLEVWNRTLDGYVASTPLVAQGRVYVGTEAGSMYCLDAMSGDIIWEESGLGLFFYSTPAFDGDAIYFGTENGDFYALDALDGSIIWTNSYSTWGTYSSPLYSNGHIYSTNRDGRLDVYDAGSGLLVDSEMLMGECTSHPAASDGWIWVQDFSGRLFGFLARMPIGLQAEPALQSKMVAPSHSVDYHVNVTNTGTLGPDTFDAMVVPGVLGWTVELLTGDGAAALPDTDADGMPDTGSLDTGQTAGAVIRVWAPADVSVGDAETSSVSFASSNDVNVSKTVTLISTVPLPGVDIGPSRYLPASPGEHVSTTVTVANTGGWEDTIDVAVDSSHSWSLSLMHDDGITPLIDTNENGMIDTGAMDGLTSMQVVVVIEVPEDASWGIVAAFTLNAVSSLDPLASDKCTVRVDLSGQASSGWPTFKQNNMRTSVGPVDYELPLTLAWEYWAEYTPISRYGPVIDNGVAYFSDADGYVHALEIDTGLPIWIAEVGTESHLGGGTAVAYGAVYSVLQREEDVSLVCLDAETGSTLWSFELPGNMSYHAPWTAPIVAQGIVYWTDYVSQIVMANDASTGEPVWSYTMPDYGWPSEPALAGGTVFAIDDVGNIVALDAATGEEIWLANIARPIYSAPTIAHGQVFVCDAAGGLHKFNASTGARLWSVYGLGDYIEIAGPTVTDEFVFVGSEDYYSGNMYCLNADSGAVIWNDSIPQGHISSASAYTNGVVFAAANDGCVYGWDAATGTRVVEMRVASSGTMTSIALGDGYLVVGHAYGVVIGLEFAGGDDLARIEVSPASANVTVASAMIFEAHAYDEWGQEIHDVEFSWKSLNDLGTIYPLTEYQEAVVYLSGEETGTDILEVSLGDLTAESVVTVVSGEAEGIRISPSFAEVSVSDTLQFEGTVVDGFGNEVPEASVTWSVTGSIGTISDSGMFTASTTAGIGTVTASCADLDSALAVVEVVPGALDSILVTPNPVVISAGETVVLVATGHDSYGNEIGGLEYTWSETIGAVTPVEGTATALLDGGQVSGTGTVIACSGDCETSVPVTVLPSSIDHLVIMPDPAEVEAGSTLEFNATPEDIFGNAINGLTISWNASPEIGSITQSGLLTASQTVGSGLVNATVGSTVQSVAVEVIPGPLATISVSPGEIVLTVGEMNTLVASGTDEYGNAVEVESFTWTSDIGTITASGNGVTAEFDAGDREGSGTITVTGGGKSVTVPVTVTDDGGAAAFAVSIGLLIAVLALAAACVMLFLKNRRLRGQNGGTGQSEGPDPGPP